MPSFRNDRIQEEMKREVYRVIRDELSDPRLKLGTISITHVDVTRDLSYAKVYVSVLEDDLKKDVIKALKSAAGFIRRELMRGMNLRYTPELQFYEDNNIAYGVRINELLKKVNAGEGQELEHTVE